MYRSQNIGNATSATPRYTRINRPATTTTDFHRRCRFSAGNQGFCGLSQGCTFSIHRPLRLSGRSSIPGSQRRASAGSLCSWRRAMRRPQHLLQRPRRWRFPQSRQKVKMNSALEQSGSRLIAVGLSSHPHGLEHYWWSTNRPH